MPIPIYKPFLPTESLKHAHEALDSGWISSHGKYIQMAQEKLQELLGVKYVQLVNNGTSACHLVAKCLAKKQNVSPSVVLVSDNSYVACWNSLLFDQDHILEPIKADLDTWNIDLDNLKATLGLYPNAAVQITHNIGNIINVPELQRQFPETIFVEDNCEGFGGLYEGKAAGTSSLCSAFSFFANKTITGGESGCLVTNDEELYHYAKCIQGQGQSDRRFVHHQLGYNYRITNIQAAILCGQLEVLDQILEMKSVVFDRYRKAFNGRIDILTQQMDPNTQHSNWMFGVRVPSNPGYDVTEAFFKRLGVEIRPMFYPIAAHRHLCNSFSVMDSDTSNAELLNRECFILPSFPELTSKEQEHILKVTEEYLQTLK